jgi:hypothetical protein
LSPADALIVIGLALLEFFSPSLSEYCMLSFSGLAMVMVPGGFFSSSSCLADGAMELAATETVELVS